MRPISLKRERSPASEQRARRAGEPTRGDSAAKRLIRGGKKRPPEGLSAPAEEGKYVRIEIVSVHAALAGGQPAITWSGEVTISELSDNLSYGHEVAGEQLGEAIFNYFTHGVGRDEHRLERIGYQLPSLTPGDILAVNGNAMVVALVGFVPLAENRGARTMLHRLAQGV